MTPNTTGVIIAVAAIGMMLGLVAVDVAGLKNWHEATTPLFIGNAMGHLAAVIAAFMGGKMILPDRTGQKTRSTDR